MNILILKKFPSVKTLYWLTYKHILHFTYWKASLASVLYKLPCENAYFRYNGTVAQQLFGKFSNHWENFFLFIESAINPTPLLCTNVQMPWGTECNRSNWGRPEFFYEPQSHHSPLQRVASRSFQSAIYTSPKGGRASMLGQINLKLMEELGCSKRLTGDCTIRYN